MHMCVDEINIDLRLCKVERIFIQVDLDVVHIRYIDICCLFSDAEYIEELSVFCLADHATKVTFICIQSLCSIHFHSAELSFYK